MKKAIFTTASAIALIGMLSSATAFDVDDANFRHFPDFQSSGCIFTPFGQDNLSEKAKANLDCEAKAWLIGRKGKALLYEVKISGMQLIDTDDDLQDDVSGIHIHFNNTDDFDNPTGPHRLNIFGEPGFDDNNSNIDPIDQTVSGIWDDGDENMNHGEPDNSYTLSNQLQNLCDGKIFYAVHGTEQDRPGHKAAYMKTRFDLTTSGERACNKLRRKGVIDY
jgi:hypothetical protein